MIVLCNYQDDAWSPGRLGQCASPANDSLWETLNAQQQDEEVIEKAEEAREESAEDEEGAGLDEVTDQEGNAARQSRYCCAEGVDASINHGRSWQQADLQRASRAWSLTIDVEPGPLSVTARARDETGAQQAQWPASLWNPRGYGNNAWARSEWTIL